MIRTRYQHIGVGLRQLHQFIAVAEELNYRRAAARLHMSQPPLTQAIRRLERLIGVVLLERNRTGVRLTAAGAVLLEEARRIASLTQSAIDASRRAAEGERGLLRLSFVASAALGPMPAIVRSFRAQYPSVQVELSSETTTGQVESLRKQRIDAGVLVPPLRGASDIEVQTLWRERLVAAVPATHPLADERSIQLRRLASEPFVLFPMAQGPAFLGAILSACLRTGFFPRVVQEAPQLQTVVALVACGLGVSIVPDSMRVLRHEAVRFVNLNCDDPPAYELGLATLTASANPIIPRFVDVAQRTLKKLPRSSEN